MDVDTDPRAISSVVMSPPRGPAAAAGAAEGCRPRGPAASEDPRRRTPAVPSATASAAPVIPTAAMMAPNLLDAAPARSAPKDPDAATRPASSTTSAYNTRGWRARHRGQTRNVQQT